MCLNNVTMTRGMCLEYNFICQICNWNTINGLRIWVLITLVGYRYKSNDCDCHINNVIARGGTSGYGSPQSRRIWRVDWGPITGWMFECEVYKNVCVGHLCHILSNAIFHHSNGITKCRFRRRHPRGDSATTKSSFTISLMAYAYKFINTKMQTNRARHDYFTGLRSSGALRPTKQFI